MGRAVPEYLEGPVKERRIGLAMHQEGACRQAEIVAAATDGDVLHGAFQVQHIGGAEVQDQAAEGFPKEEEVGEDGADAGIGRGGVEVNG